MPKRDESAGGRRVAVHRRGGAGGDRSVAVGELPGAAGDRRAALRGTLPTETDARVWAIETRAAVAERRRAASLTFAAYAERWLAGSIDDAPDRARFEAALEQRLLAAIGQLRLLELLEKDRNELYRQAIGSRGYGDDGAMRECLDLILEEAVEDLRAGTLDAGTASGGIGSVVELVRSRGPASSVGR